MWWVSRTRTRHSQNTTEMTTAMMIETVTLRRSSSGVARQSYPDPDLSEACSTGNQAMAGLSRRRSCRCGCALSPPRSSTRDLTFASTLLAMKTRASALRSTLSPDSGASVYSIASAAGLPSGLREKRRRPPVSGSASRRHSRAISVAAVEETLSTCVPPRVVLLLSLRVHAARRARRDKATKSPVRDSRITIARAFSALSSGEEERS